MRQDAISRVAYIAVFAGEIENFHTSIIIIMNILLLLRIEQNAEAIRLFVQSRLFISSLSVYDTLVSEVSGWNCNQQMMQFW